MIIPIGNLCRLALPALALIALTSCQFLHRNSIGLFSSDEPPQTESNAQPFRSEGISDPHSRRATTTIDVEKLQDRSADTDTGQVEIIWEIPKEAVDAYVIQYGIQRESLDKTVRVSTAEIERYEDPQFGFVYRHVLRNVPSDKVVFVAMATIRGEIQSELSKIIEVAPQNRPVAE